MLRRDQVEQLRIVDREGGAVRISIHAKPRASKSAIVGVREAALEVAIAAPPVDGEANAELVRTLAKALGLSRSSVSVVGGATGKQKIVEVEGLTAAEVRERLVGG